MPQRNTRDRAWRGPHHVYNRASRGRAVFRDDNDRDVFLEILASRLSSAKFRSNRYRKAPLIVGADVSSYCLMTTHFHLVVWQHEDEALRRLMQSVLHAYVLSYNHKYNLRGPLFAGPFRSRAITDNKQLRWTTAYVHANHPSGPDYRYSSHQAFSSDEHRPGWLTTTKALEAFGSRSAYAAFMSDHSLRAELNRRFFSTTSAVGSNQ